MYRGSTATLLYVIFQNLKHILTCSFCLNSDLQNWLFEFVDTTTRIGNHVLYRLCNTFMLVSVSCSMSLWQLSFSRISGRTYKSSQLSSNACFHSTSFLALPPWESCSGITSYTIWRFQQCFRFQLTTFSTGRN